MTVLALTLLLALGAPERPSVTDRGTLQSLEMVLGSGPDAWDVAACLGCGIAIAGVSGTTIGGFLLGAIFYPEMYGACAYLCAVAF